MHSIFYIQCFKNHSKYCVTTAQLNGGGGFGVGHAYSLEQWTLRTGFLGMDSPWWAFKQDTSFSFSTLLYLNLLLPWLLPRTMLLYDTSCKHLILFMACLLTEFILPLLILYFHCHSQLGCRGSHFQAPCTQHWAWSFLGGLQLNGA